MRRFLIRILALFAAPMMCATTAQAGLFRAYVASTGSDTNPCTVSSPCRLLPAALTAVNDGGEIWMLDSANYNTANVDITKSVTILAIPGVVGSVVATGGGNAITINTPAVKVTLKNLVVVHLTSSADGISFQQGAELNVADCEIANIQNNGISAFATGARFTVRNTAVHDANVGIYVSGTVVAAIDSLHAHGNGIGVDAFSPARVTISNSVISGGSFGVLAGAFAVSTVRLTIERSHLAGNTYGMEVHTNVAGDVAEVTLSDSTVSDSITAGLYVNQAASSALTVVSDGNTYSDNGVGILFLGSPTVYTRGNNTMKFNSGGDLSGGGSLTALAGQ